MSSTRMGVALLALATGLLAGGCASPSRVALTSGQRTQIQSSHGMIGLAQQEIGADINQSNLTAAAGGGLLFALIDAGVNNSRAKKAVNSVSPVRDALIGYEPGQVLSTAVQGELVSQPWIHLERVEVRSINEKTIGEAWVTGASGDAVLIVQPSYRLTPAMDGVTITAAVSLHGRTPALKTGAKAAPGRPAAIYFNTVAAVMPMPGWPGKMPPAEAAKLWADRDGEKIRATLDAGFAEIARLIAFDLPIDAQPENALYKTPPGATERMTPAIAGRPPIQFKGHVVKTVSGRVWVRTPLGELYSLPE